MTRLNTRKNRRSPESVDSKIVFDDEDPPVIVGEPILPHDDWVFIIKDYFGINTFRTPFSLPGIEPCHGNSIL